MLPQEKFGKEVTITKGGVKVGLKNVDDFESDADTDDLAEDSDLDVSTCEAAFLSYLLVCHCPVVY